MSPNFSPSSDAVADDKPSAADTGDHVLQDETGSWSFARCALVFTLAQIAVLIGCSIAGKHFDNSVWTVVTTQLTVFAMWAGGARVSAYLGPQLGSIMSAVGSAVQARIPSVEPSKNDDERGTDG
jgi:hypothetical protein